MYIDDQAEMDRFLNKAAGENDPSVLVGYGEHELGPSM